MMSSCPPYFSTVLDIFSAHARFYLTIIISDRISALGVDLVYYAAKQLFPTFPMAMACLDQLSQAKDIKIFVGASIKVRANLQL
jgi:hypothetical protein